MSLNEANLEIIKKLNYIPVGLKNKNFSNSWMRDNTGENISHKNPFYGEYTFYYWYWKNLLDLKKDNEWIGFCSYREYWGKKKNYEFNKLDKIENIVLQSYQPEWEGFDAIIGEPLNISGIKFIKAMKYGKMSLLRNPKAIFFKSGQTIRFHFDMFHGNGNLDKAIEMLPDKDRDDFKYFVRTENSFARGNMFISKNKEIIQSYFKDVFEWMLKCEKIFGFELSGYSQIRIYTFLAERFLPFWFKKYTKYLEWPVVFKDINKF